MEKLYTVIYEPVAECGYVVHIPALNGIVTQGETLEEAELMAIDLIQGYIEALKIKGLPIPEEPIEASPELLNLKQVAIAV